MDPAHQWLTSTGNDERKGRPVDEEQYVRAQQRMIDHAAWFAVKVESRDEEAPPGSTKWIGMGPAACRDLFDVLVLNEHERFVLRMNLTTAAFEDAPGVEVAALLREAADRIEQDTREGVIRDPNGKTVGGFVLHHCAPDDE